MKIQLTEKAAEILLALTALIWGSGFVCYKNLMSLLTPIQFVVVRSFFSAVCAGLFFLCVIRRASRREWEVFCWEGFWRQPVWYRLMGYA